jgi:hypothetical protein
VVYGTAVAQAPVLPLQRYGDDDLFDAYADSFERVWTTTKPPTRLNDRASGVQQAKPVAKPSLPKALHCSRDVLDHYLATANTAAVRGLTPMGASVPDGILAGRISLGALADPVASLTDAQAVCWHAQLHSRGPVSTGSR